MKNKILFVEDETDMRKIVSEVLHDEGFEVLTASDGAGAINKIRNETLDLVIADVMMPVMDGFTMAKEIRKFNTNIPILFLTAKSRIEDLEEGFETGANDYLKKPFEFRELIVRIKALLRNSKPHSHQNNLYQIGDYLFNANSQVLKYGNIEDILSNFETKILQKLVANIGHTVDSTDMMLSIWHNDDLSNRNSLHGYIHKLRKLLKKDSRIKIINQRGFGYMLIVKQ